MPWICTGIFLFFITTILIGMCLNYKAWEREQKRKSQNFGNAVVKIPLPESQPDDGWPTTPPRKDKPWHSDQTNVPLN